MLAVTHHLSTDVRPSRCSGSAPLALYLATFVAAFAVRSRVGHGDLASGAAGLGMATLALAPLAATLSLWVTITVNLLLVVVVGYAAHRLLAARRPSPEHLTTYYLAVAVGGALGGVVNGLLAPLLFDRVLEYGLVVALLPLLGLGATWPATRSGRTRSAARRHRRGCWSRRPCRRCWTPAAAVSTLALLALAAFTLLGWVLAGMPVGMTVALVVAVIATALVSDTGVVLRERTFYGSYTVHADDLMTSLDHGTTMHGLQLRAPSLRDEPTTYYGREAPLGDLLGELQPGRTAAVGLGVGTLAAYGEPGDRITFLEIDEAVADIARDERYFTFLARLGRRCRRPDRRRPAAHGRPARAGPRPRRPGRLQLRRDPGPPADAGGVRALRRPGRSRRRDRRARRPTATSTWSRWWQRRRGSPRAGPAPSGEAARAWGPAEHVGRALAGPGPRRLAALAGALAAARPRRDAWTWTDDYSSVLTVLR